MTPVVNAEAGASVNEDSIDDEELSDDQQVRKKQKREKVGFRDRKVMNIYLATTAIEEFTTNNHKHSLKFFFIVSCFCSIPKIM